MSLGLVVSHGRPKKISEGQYVADLASLFERRRIDLGDPHVCEQFEILFTTSDSFRSQLFTLCTAISHMSENDLSGEELLDLIARALRAEPEDGTTLPETLKKSFLSGLDAWNNRGLSGQDEWPPIKKPVASVDQPPIPVIETAEERPSKPAATGRPAGVRTLQEALELARVRGGNLPLRPETIAASAAPAPETEPAPTDTNSAAIQELNALLAEIEQRMKRLGPQLAADGVGEAPALSPSERDAAFLARHPYLSRERPRPLFETEVVSAAETEPAASMKPIAASMKQTDTPPAAATPDAEAELQLVPRNVTVEESEPGPPKLIIPDALRFKTYLAIAVLAGIGLVGTPISGVIAYRYMHPLYIYDQAKPAAPAVAQPIDDPKTANAAAAKSGAQGKSARSSRKAQAAKRKPPVAVWPPPPQQ
ncbi:MAG TPA: hypothetical protein VHU44_17065 [Acidobacteriaceae bacterium]|jgi:hypothetical protein|nr:hypothetical protein [Acidobacteriaceae bacterium]